MSAVTPLQLLRSIVKGKRPDAKRLLPGQPAVNTNIEEPGFFFADSTGNNLIKIGPCAVDSKAPNSGAAPPGEIGNSKGELWLDTSGDFAVLRVYTDNGWVSCMPYIHAGALVAEDTPSLEAHPANTMWWNSTNGKMYILYDDGDSRQWTQVTSSVAQ